LLVVQTQRGVQTLSATRGLKRDWPRPTCAAASRLPHPHLPPPHHSPESSSQWWLPGGRLAGGGRTIAGFKGGYFMEGRRRSAPPIAGAPFVCSISSLWLCDM